MGNRIRPADASFNETDDRRRGRLNADRCAVPDVGQLGASTGDSLAELLEAAG